MKPALPLIAATLAALACVPATTWAQAATPPAAAAEADNPLRGAELIGTGRLTAFRKGASTLVVLPPGTLGKPVLWYTEVVGVPAGLVARALEVGHALARLERVGNLVHVRDMSTVQNRRAAPLPTGGPLSPVAVPGAAPRDPKLRPIEVAISSTETGAIIASFPIVGLQPDGTLLIDVTATFSNDIPAVTGRTVVAKTGVVPMAVDPSKSFIQRVRMRGDALNLRSHLTFLAVSPAAQADGPRPVSVVLGHSIVFLPEKPMAARPADPRVGYFTSEYTAFEPGTGVAQDKQVLIGRFRLEKADPAAAVSDPIKPITYYLGRGIPERWKPHITAGVLQWLPVFEAIGFRNAIRVLDAPTPEQDPDWSPEDVTINVIRWLPEEHVNAMGPRVADPRSGETLSAHIVVWPSVIDYFSKYYWAAFGGSGVDPAAPRLPLSDDKAGQILAYAVAHEVGHTLGLMHNQLASTAYSVQQMRQPEFANRFGPNSSIMAYGRFNQAAQPGDGVTQLFSKIGAYDRAAIRYGYGVFGTDPASERRELAAFADTFSRDRQLFWGSEESGELIARFGRDPRVQTENTGAERVAATRLGVANLLRSLNRLDAGTGGDAKLYAATYGVVLGHHVALLQSVQRLVAGVMPAMGAGEGPRPRLVPAAEQREAVRYLAGEGAASLEPYAATAVAERVAVFGANTAVDRLQAGLITDLLSGSTVALLEAQQRDNPSAYAPQDFGQDLSTAVWGQLKTATPTQRALQRGYIAAAQTLLRDWAKGGAGEAAEAKAVIDVLPMSGSSARALVETGDDSVFIPWLRNSLPGLKTRLEAAARSAASPTDRLHFAEMAVQAGRLLKISQP